MKSFWKDFLNNLLEMLQWISVIAVFGVPFVIVLAIISGATYLLALTEIWVGWSIIIILALIIILGDLYITIFTRLADKWIYEDKENNA